MPGAAVTICTASGARQVCVRPHANRGLGGWIPGQFLIGSSVEHRVSGLPCGVARDPRDAHAPLQTAPLPPAVSGVTDGGPGRHDRPACARPGPWSVGPAPGQCLRLREPLGAGADGRGSQVERAPGAAPTAGPGGDHRHRGCPRLPEESSAAHPVATGRLRVDAEGQWPALRRLLLVEAERRVGGQVSVETRYCISRHPPPMPDTCWRPRGRTG